MWGVEYSHYFEKTPWYPKKLKIGVLFLEDDSLGRFSAKSQFVTAVRYLNMRQEFIYQLVPEELQKGYF